MTRFTPAGSRDGIALVQHACPRNKVTYVSAGPSAPGDPYVVPMCGCRPDSTAGEGGSS